VNPLLRVSIVIPVHNEADTITTCLQRIQRHLTIPHEILIVHDTEDDTTIKPAREAAIGHHHIRILHNTYGRGPANAIRYGIDHGLRMTHTKLRGVRPVGGGAPAVQQTRGTEHERSGAQRDDAGARVVRSAHGFDGRCGRRLIDVDTSGNDHGVGCDDMLQPVVWLDHERADLERLRPTETNVVPAARGFEWRVAEDLVGHAQLEMQQATSGQQGDCVLTRAHVRKCTHTVV
jgi:glycosyltransferase involved in cell wall biosynthesis